MAFSHYHIKLPQPSRREQRYAERHKPRGPEPKAKRDAQKIKQPVTHYAHSGKQPIVGEYTAAIHKMEANYKAQFAERIAQHLCLQPWQVAVLKALLARRRR